MPSQNDDSQRPTRQRANTSAFPFGWRRKAETTTPAPPAISAPLQWEALIEVLTPPAVPSLSYAKSLATALGALDAHSPPPRLAALQPILASLCSSESPTPLQAAGYDILAAYLEGSGSAIITTADKLSCLSLFIDVPWSQELWESRTKALSALIASGSHAVGMEGPILRMLESWIERAFDGLTRTDAISHEDRLERQRSVQSLTTFLTNLVRRPEFVSRLTEDDTAGVLDLWERLVDRSLAVPVEYLNLISPPSSPFLEPQSSKAASPPKLSLSHRRHHSSTSLPKLSLLKHPADIIVDAYLTYLSERLVALAPSFLTSILPLLFRALAFYSTPLPRISLQPSVPHQNTLEQKISDVLAKLVGGPYASSCKVLLKRHFFPSRQVGLQSSIQAATGAIRTLRISLRRVLENRLARAYIERASINDYSPAGVPMHLSLEKGLMERAWPADEGASWDLIRFASVLARAAKAWIAQEQETAPNVIATPKEAVLHEIAAIIKDAIQAMDERGDNEDVDDEEITAIGRILRELVVYVRSVKTPDGGLIPISLHRPDGSSPFLVAIATILAQDLKTSPLFLVLPSIILSIAEHLPDRDLTQLLITMAERQSLSPTSLSWLDEWNNLLTMSSLFASSRTATRQHVMEQLHSVWEFVKDIPAYRKPLATLVFDVWKRHPAEELEDSSTLVVWNLLADEAVMRLVEKHADNPDTAECEEHEGLCEEILDFLLSMALERQDEEDDTASIRTVESQVPSPPGVIPPANSVSTSPILSRMTSDYPGTRDKETSLPSVMSILTSLTSGAPSRSQSKPRRATNDMPVPTEASPAVTAEPPSFTPKAVGAVIGLVSVFSQLVFTPLAISQCSLWHAKRIFGHLVELISSAGCVRARLTVLQFMMRLRVDRDHRLYYTSTEYDRDGNIAHLAALINRAEVGPSTVEDLLRDDEIRRARARAPPQERDGRRPSRGRGAPRMEASRSRSRVPARALPAVMLRLKPREPLWSIPEALSLSVMASDVASEGMNSFDPSNPGHNEAVLQLSAYLSKLVEIIETERDWEILSYVLCHLPTQLANKHLFCGPRSKIVISRLLASLCSGITDGTLATKIERWPDGIISRDAQGLAFHTLNVLISYKRCFDNAQQLHHLVEVFLMGLNGQPSTQRCCLHALSLAAFELQPSMAKHLSRIMEKLSQIMSNPAMAVHIIDFLAIVGSQRALYVNFTEGDYKMVFAVALKYLENHNRADGSLSISWALSQHVRIMSYYIVYVWFLAVDLEDRHRHVSYIVRQLLLANSNKADVDAPTEVAFDWLARYTYASADPRPAKSTLDEIVMNPNLQSKGSEPAISEKTWILGNSVVTIRALARRGWIEVISRRASGMTKFLVRAENIPMIPLGDVDPDLVSISATLMMDREDNGEDAINEEDATNQFVGNPSLDDVKGALGETAQAASSASRPDPITGYVWSGSAPSQRRKEVAIDPSYFALQLSAYPDKRPVGRGRLVKDKSKLASFFRIFDRMPVIDTHKVGVMYVAPGQQTEAEILRNTHGSPAYTRFLEGLGRLINLRGQVDVYDGGLDPDVDGEYAYAWWDDIGQILFHTATLMPTGDDPNCTSKKAHIGNDYVRIVWNDSGRPYRFDTLATQFQFVNIVIEPHSRGAIAAFSNNLHEHEYFKVTVQRAEGMVEFTPIGDFKLISAANLPQLVRQLSLLSDWFIAVWQNTGGDKRRDEVITNWRSRLEAIQRFRDQTLAADQEPEPGTADSLAAQQRLCDFSAAY
ncbi:Tuberous sclerosis 2 protein -like protein [Trametes pubescens]|uniref:Tuberous sclerosis 2 protein-like protein n=1 Tax=Trametes pubescens TaxID=154538 RepID=A0A1M2VXL5_TRAPU|nr:Tuberous sclerosis 2 protein -like protein [Trametes pubescens]